MSNPKIAHLSPQDFENLVKTSNDTYLIDFWAEWCGPCKMMNPTLDWMADTPTAESVFKIAKINIDDEPALLQKILDDNKDVSFDGVPFSVQGIPNFVLIKFNAGTYKVIGQMVGSRNNRETFLTEIQSKIDKAAA